MQVLLRALPVPEAALQATQKQVLGIMLNHQHKRAAVCPPPTPLLDECLSGTDGEY